MTQHDLVSMAESLCDFHHPALPEASINQRDGRKLHEEINANACAAIGSTMWLHRSFGFPDLQSFIDQYFASGEAFERLPAAQQVDRASEFGRTPGHILELCNRLYAHASAQPIGGSTYSLESVTEWFLHLVFVRTVLGNIAQVAVWHQIGGMDNGWRQASLHEDTHLGADFVHDRTDTMLQVKQCGWHQKKILLAEWQSKSAQWKSRRWLAEYDSRDCDVAFFRCEDGPVGADLQSLKVAVGATS